VGLEDRHRRVVDLADRLPVLLREAVEEVLGEERHVADALAKGGMCTGRH